MVFLWGCKPGKPTTTGIDTLVIVNVPDWEAPPELAGRVETLEVVRVETVKVEVPTRVSVETVKVSVPTIPESLQMLVQYIKGYPSVTYLIQFGSFENENQADSLYKLVVKRFPSAYKEWLSPFWNIRMGSYKDVEEAYAKLQEVIGAGFTTATIVTISGERGEIVPFTANLKIIEAPTIETVKIMSVETVRVEIPQTKEELKAVSEKVAGMEARVFYQIQLQTFKDQKQADSVFNLAKKLFPEQVYRERLGTEWNVRVGKFEDIALAYDRLKDAIDKGFDKSVIVIVSGIKPSIAEKESVEVFVERVPSLPEGIIFRIQIGAFVNPEHADELYERVRKFIQPVYKEFVDPYWKIRVGDYSSLFQAYEKLIEIHDRYGFDDAFIVKIVGGKSLLVRESFKLLPRKVKVPVKEIVRETLKVPCKVIIPGYVDYDLAQYHMDRLKEYFENVSLYWSGKRWDLQIDIKEPTEPYKILHKVKSMGYKLAKLKYEKPIEKLKYEGPKEKVSISGTPQPVEPTYELRRIIIGKYVDRDLAMYHYNTLLQKIGNVHIIWQNRRWLVYIGDFEKEDELNRVKAQLERLGYKGLSVVSAK